MSKVNLNIYLTETDELFLFEFKTTPSLNCGEIHIPNLSLLTESIRASLFLKKPCLLFKKMPACLNLEKMKSKHYDVSDEYLFINISYKNKIIKKPSLNSELNQEFTFNEIKNLIVVPE